MDDGNNHPELKLINKKAFIREVSSCSRSLVLHLLAVKPI